MFILGVYCWFYILLSRRGCVKLKNNDDVFFCLLVCFYFLWCCIVKYICGIFNYERDVVYIDFFVNCRLLILKVFFEMFLFYVLLILWLLFFRVDLFLEYLYWWYFLCYVFFGE